jgi:hypothetical protein
MTQSPKAPRARPRPPSASPAERSEEFAAHQRRLKAEAAERRRQSAAAPLRIGKQARG